ncbi:type IV secretion system protein VirD4 [Palleronia aestuarii]|uniref:Type IV secretion system protein VirD4 n=1 Tax=Palleronia aestuarii TaxID=568105 RepID=A0A2W7N3A8_9RHOB|nr:type IV secretory system conjugative DNA transfer family protein [Palleronia aestuarii]PZX14173.1 type IV secretion system protein VirD4 [Palleronia aestuarii]
MSPSKSILPLALGGLLIGLLLGSIVAGAYASWVVGRDPTNVGFTTIFDFMPLSLQDIPKLEPIRTALMIWAAIAVVAAIAIPAIGRPRQLTSHGSARWATQQELKKAGLSTQIRTLNGPIYAKFGPPNSNADFFSSREIPHCMAIAPTGSGKTRGITIPTVLTYPGSIFALDMKGELFAKTSRRRMTFGDKVFKFAPLDDNDRTHRYNPLQVVLDAHPRRQFTEAKRVASSFIIAHGNGQGFLEGAREIFTAAAIHVIEKGTPTIGAILDALSQPGESSKLMWNLGDETKSEDARKIFYKMSGMESRILSSYLSVLGDGGLSLWNNPAIRAATSKSDFTFANLRSEPATIYFVVSDNDLSDLAPLVRLMFQQAIKILKRAEPDPEKGEKYTVLFCLDEFASLGRMDALMDGIATLRSFGGRVMIILQTLGQLRKHYDKDGETIFLSNCRIQLFMSAADEETPRYVSEAVGDFTRKSRSKSWKGGQLTTSYQEREDGARLIRPEQVRMLGKNTILALVEDSYPVIASKVIYYEDKILKPIFDDQTGPLPEPPVLPDDPISETAQPLAPAQSSNGSNGADNPLAALRPATVSSTPAVDPDRAKDGAASEAPVPDKAAVSEPTVAGPNATDVGDAEPDDSQEAAELAALYPVRDKCRRLDAALTLAQEMYAVGMRSEEKNDAAPAQSAPEDVTNEGDEASKVGNVDETSSQRPKGLRRANLSQAQANIFPNKDETGQDRPEPDQPGA